MAEPDLKPIDHPITSSEIDKFYALYSLLSDIDRFLETPSFEKNDFVDRIIRFLLDDGKNWSENRSREKIGIDFSSPNIAKPFHVGHLRSTFIGRAIANLSISSGSNVMRINYLGDWGMQFGLLATAFNEISKGGGDPSTNTNRMRLYFDLYVKANERADSDPEFRRKALEYFGRLENGTASEGDVQFWRRVVDESVHDLKKLYARLNVEFDVWASEQAAARPAKALLEDLLKRKILERNEENLIGINCGDGERARFIPLARGDGTTLYLTRDVHSALHRFDNLGCTKLIYVTDSSQGYHFKDLKDVLAKIGRPDIADHLTHVRFGRVRGMSTRKGQAVFVDDVLKEGIKKAEADVLSPDPHTKTPAGTAERRVMGEQLTMSCLIVNDLRHELGRGYDFDWNRILETKKDGGVALQKTFCRISSICEQCAKPSVDADTFRRSMNEKQALAIIGHVTRNLAPVLRQSIDQSETYPLIHNLFQLRKMCGSAVRNLRVVDAPSPALKSSRFLLFDVARKVMGLGIRLVGAKPLAKI